MATTVEEYLHPSDVRKSHVLTRVIDRTIQEGEVYNVPFMPIKAFNGDKVLMKVKEMAGAGLAAFKADNANTPIVGGYGDLQDIYMELVTLSEKHVIKASDFKALNSPDNAVAAHAARTIADLGVDLRRRNINRTKWMAWQAAKDALTITYPNGASIGVDWDLDATSHNDWMSGSHKPSPAQDWDHTDTDGRYDTDIITDIYTWTKLIADDLGVAEQQCILHMNSTTWRVVRRNKYVIEELSDVDRRRPATLAEAADVLDVAEIKLVNDFYLNDDTTRTKQYFLDEGELMITAPYVVNGVPLAEMYDGIVPMVTGNGNNISVARNAGMRAEVYLNPEQVSQNIRVTTSRMPIINYPAGFVYVVVYS